MPSGVYVRTDEYKKMVSLSKLGKPSGLKPMLGKHHTEEAKKK